MDLVAALTQALDTDAPRAEAVAGGLMGAVQAIVAQKAGPEIGQKLGAAVPELSGWQSTAAATLGKAVGGGAGGGGVAGLLGGLTGGGGAASPVEALTQALAGGAGGGATPVLVAFSQILGQLGLDPAKAMAIGSVLLGFLQSRLSPELMAQVTQAVPALSAMGGAAGGGLFGMLGGMFGGTDQRH